MARKSCYFCNSKKPIRRRVGGQPCCPSCSDQIDAIVMKKNPQLQILENPQLQILENPDGVEGVTLGGLGSVDVIDDIDSDDILEDKPQLQHLECIDDHLDDLPKTLRKFCKFHDVKKFGREIQMDINDGKNGIRHITFAGYGKVPFVSWIDEENGKNISFKVQKDPIVYKGFRISTGNKPWLVGCPYSDEALIIGPGVTRFKEFIKDNSGFIGIAPTVDYTVPWKSNKQGDHYVHGFYHSSKPKLIWDNEFGGLRYKGGAYRISDWFYD